MLAAVIISDQSGPVEDSQAGSPASSWATSWTALEVLGQAPISRLAGDLKSACDAVWVVANSAQASSGTTSDMPTGDPASECFASCKRESFEAVLVVRCGAYVEINPTEMLGFHEREGWSITRAFTESGPLDVWMVSPSALPEEAPLLPTLFSAQTAMYRSQGYVNLLRTARDFRQLVLDGFYARCRLRPRGTETKPGIWVGHGAQIERSSRIVAPAFIGRNVRISDECLVTRATNIESDCHVDFGTAVEDSSVLSNTYLGIGLDLSHSVVNGRNLLNLWHNVNLAITDPVVMRDNPGTGRGHQSWASVYSGPVALSSAE